MAALFGLFILLPACAVSGLSIIQDKRLVILKPADRAAVSLPLTVKWKVHDFAITGPDESASANAGYFGVFVDRAPQPPGERLEWIARGDRSCSKNEGCPDERYLADRGVYQTKETDFTIDQVRELIRAKDGTEFHEVIIILLNGRGERIGESSFSVEFSVIGRRGDQ